MLWPIMSSTDPNQTSHSSVCALKASLFSPLKHVCVGMRTHSDCNAVLVLVGSLSALCYSESTVMALQRPLNEPRKTGSKCGVQGRKTRADGKFSHFAPKEVKIKEVGANVGKGKVCRTPKVLWSSTPAHICTSKLKLQV